MNTTAKHTPGPWNRNIRAKGKYPTVFAGRNQHVAVVNQQKDPSETEANIDLIAAAPELLEALQFVQKYSVLRAARGEPMPSQLLESIDKAVAKAEGRS